MYHTLEFADELTADLEISPNLNRWDPFNRQMYFGGRIMLPGHLLASKGDRVAMHSSVETRYPFLDERVFDFLARLHPRWKMRGLTDKYLLRKVAERWLPRQIAWRHILCREHKFHVRWACTVIIETGFIKDEGERLHEGRAKSDRTQEPVLDGDTINALRPEFL